ncbi:uncharacterized protein LOC110699268 [Chenopodium quinoa]|uniref:uncharacterized protein LOC110699268 n=1 Tax=Chenopodium quinoa TaxID=63459 RepID=UPI000B77D788|nr:uncharacterized protein LOC110699268 [Chenopodium quinoa]
MIKVNRSSLFYYPSRFSLLSRLWSNAATPFQWWLCLRWPWLKQQPWGTSRWQGRWKRTWQRSRQQLDKSSKHFPAATTRLIPTASNNLSGPTHLCGPISPLSSGLLNSGVDIGPYPPAHTLRPGPIGQPRSVASPNQTTRSPPQQAYVARPPQYGLLYSPTELGSAYSSMTLANTDNEWYMYSGATSHMAHNSGPSDGEDNHEM